jgi:two-component system LytT family response regulator
MPVSPPPPPSDPSVLRSLRVLVVDDDATARRHIADVLGPQPDVENVGECADGECAVTQIAELKPHLVFLDVQMPKLDGFGVVARVGASRMPPVVFTSAYAEFAVRAFEAYAIDYVLKPFDDARFLAALARAREQVTVRAEREAARESASRESASRESVEPSAADPRLRALLAHLAAPARPRYPDAVAVKSGGQYVVLRVEDVDWIEADGNYARLHVHKRPRLITKSLATLERDVLDPARFVRVHRSAIVNVAKIAAVEPLFHGDVSLVLHDGTKVDCSRRFRERLEERLYFTT